VYLDTSSSYKKVVYPFTVAGFTPDSVLINIYSSFCTNCWSSGGLPNSDIGSDLKIDSMRFTSQLPINVAPFNPSFCAGSNVKITASGATTYTWAPSSGLSATTGATVTANPFSTTTYTVTGKTGPLTGTQKVIVTVNNLPTINISPPAPTICSGNSVNLTASSTSVSYTWSPSIGLNVTTGAVVSANPSSNQVYTATGTTSAGCSNSNSVTVKVTATPTVSVSSSSLIICGSGSANLTAAGATTYIWKPATGLSATTGFSVVATPTATTTYTVFGTSGTCSDSATIIETVDSPIKLTMKTTNVTCSGLCNGTSSGNVSGGTPPYNYSWSTGASTSSINGICAGTYTLTVNDGLGCAAFGPITVTEPKALIVGTSPVPTSCGQSNGQGIATPTGGTTPYTYSWNTIPVQNTQNASALASGNYTVTVTDSNKCTATGTVSIAASTAPSVSVKVTPGNCGTHNGVATATTTGGTSPYRYSWNNGDTIPTADSLAAGVYIITVTDKNGCSSFKAVTVSDTNGPSLAVNSVTQNKCYGQSMGAISVTASGGKSPYSYSWSNSATTTSISNLSAGPYQITVTDKNGCTVVKTINITAPLAIGLTTATTQAGCGSSNGDASVSASGGTVPYSYLWSTSGTSSSVSNVSAGTYQVVVTDKNGCKDSVDASVSNAAGPVVKITSVTDNNCSTGTMGSISISDSGGTTPYTYSWSNGATTSNITNLNAGVYNITVTDAGGCKGTANTKVTEVQPPAISICMVTVDPPTNHNEIIWNKTATKKIARYNIYKETTSPGVFNKIGSVPVDSQCVYIDSLSNALVRSWRYEISQVDSCGDESPLSLPHKTMHLTISPGVGNQFNLIWDNYQGLTFGYYIIYRDSVPGKASDSVGWITNSGIYTYTDIVPTLTHSWYYHMGIDNPGGCTPAIEAINYNSSKSNTGNVTVSGIPQVDAELNSLEVYPNPTTGMVNMSISLAGEKQNVGIRVINTMGQVLWNSKYNNVSGSLKKQIDLSAYSKGIYIVQVTTDNGVMFRKVVIQ
ncbi:MAG TPA: T9SS type A sorting domain-containing protein, partial [Bacteroidia bacterium]|nr:T9SS type A sorting domain-containing protein [Bacteroidia bacterium]